MKSPFRVAMIAALILMFVQKVVAQSEFETIDRYVPHVSTVGATLGEVVPLFVHEKYSQETAELIAAGDSPAEVVLFIHGGTIPSVPAFDLQFKDYSWMEYLARDGFDAFSMDQTGYGFSPRPMMDDPCNLWPEDQVLVSASVYKVPCDPAYQNILTSFRNDWDEIDSVVDYIRHLRGVERVHLIGWSMGGARAGGYAASHPEKVGNVVLFAPFYPPEPGSTLDGGPAVPMKLQTRERLMGERWEEFVACENQVDPEIRRAGWNQIMEFEPLGSIWGSPNGVMRWPTIDWSAWNSLKVAEIVKPTLILIGTDDGLLSANRRLYSELTGTDSKVLVEMDCATHMASWEQAQYRFMHAASREWLKYGQIRGIDNGVLAVGVDGAPKPQ